MVFQGTSPLNCTYLTVQVIYRIDSCKDCTFTILTRCSPYTVPNLLVKTVPAQPVTFAHPGSLDVPLHQMSTHRSCHLVAAHRSMQRAKIRQYARAAPGHRTLLHWKFWAAKLGTRPLHRCGPYTSLYGNIFPTQYVEIFCCKIFQFDF